MYRLFAAALAAASCAAIAQAQTPPPAEAGAVLTLEDALAQAGATSPSTEVATAGVRAAEAARTVAGLRPNPTLEVQSENIAGTGDFRGLSSAETTVGVALPLELGGKRSARVAVADARTDRARIEAAIALADLRLRVTQAFTEAAAAERRLAIAEDQARIAAQNLKNATDRVDVGAASPIDQQRATVAQVNAAAALESARRTVELSRVNLARLTGRPFPGGLDLTWFERLPATGPQPAISADRTLALAAASADLATANAQVRLARAQRVPDLTVSAGARRLSASNDTAAVVGVSIPIPLFNNGQAAVGQARAEQNQAEARRRLARLEAEREIAQAETDLANAAATARATTGPGLSAALEAARIARIGYGQGKFDQLQLLEAERTLAETRAAATQALQTYHDATARLERLTVPAPQLSGDNR
ncbi:TolC family protein [Sphingomonas sp. ID1715]|uniref:TolC family protein n=1 Tax=Sphingomonas sp. ID1715 TaxID=1656898 RepID=UPI001489B91B|nr:TolC family protein [Sphingomonas sp. ID1715]NNM77710.1 TolC family protein [Sphingomonas sp. ID1715]